MVSLNSHCFNSSSNEKEHTKHYLSFLKKERKKFSTEEGQCHEHQGQNRRTRTAISAHYSFLLKPQPDLLRYKQQQQFPGECNVV